MNLGQTLKSAREAKGLTASELAAQTRMLVQIVEGLEANDYRQIPAPIYGRGFIKLYAEAVGLDPAPLREAFTAAYAAAQEAAAWKAPAPVSAQEPKAPREPAMPTPVQPVMEQPDVVQGLDLFENAVRTAAPNATPAPKQTASPHRYAESPFSDAYANEESDSSAVAKFRTGLSNVSHGVLGTAKHIPKSVWRIACLIGAIAGCAALLFWGIHSLYELTATDPTAQKQEVATEKPKVVEPAAVQAKQKTATKPILKQTPSKQSAAKQPTTTKKPSASTSGARIPALYID